MEPTLPTLAIKLVELIARFLGPTDLSFLRLACKNLHRKSLHSFGACFTTFRTDFSSKSLQKLQVISEDDNLRLYVQKLLIQPREGETLGQGFQWDRHSSGHLEGQIVAVSPRSQSAKLPIVSHLYSRWRRVRCPHPW